MKEKEMIETFMQLVTSGEIDNMLKKISMPNIPFPTMGGKVFWNNLATCNGWKLQKNCFTQHCRILDQDDVRRVWGGDDAMAELFENLQK